MTYKEAKKVSLSTDKDKLQLDKILLKIKEEANKNYFDLYTSVSKKNLHNLFELGYSITKFVNDNTPHLYIISWK
jgi:hypothetical protein